LNSHDGKFRNVSNLLGPAFQIPRVSRGVATGDLFNDGRIDIVIENLEGGPTILRPRGGPPNHWISLELEGTKTNRLALNARVKATAGNLVQTGEVLSGGSYLSQNDLRLHFGLGERPRVDKVEIFWPSGKTETLNDLAADHFYKVKEGEGIVSTEGERSTPPAK
jgi:enediyne biosynthesis protein E4